MTTWNNPEKVKEISPNFYCFYGGGIRHNEDIMHSFQNFIVSANSQPPSPSRDKDIEISCESAARNIVHILNIWK